VDVTRSTPGPDVGGTTGWRRAAAVARGVAIATPLVLMFGALFMSADAVFSDLVLNTIRIDFDLIAGHLVLFSVCACFWELKTERAVGRQTGAGTWEVTLDARARKVVVDPAGVETEMPMDEQVQIGVFAPGGQGPDFGETLYLQMHRIGSGKQTITVTVPREPSDAGIDAFHLLTELERFDNVEEVEIER
jgi:hypothetical protein